VPERNIVFRFDVDTHVCVRDGMPPLLRLAEREGVPFTFFVNPGRAVSLAESLRSRSAAAGTPRMKARTKLGGRGFAEALLLNPRLLSWAPVLSDALNAGHEVGQHGGRNHAIWQARASSWSGDRFRDEVEWGSERLAAAIPGWQPGGFASPGWVNNPDLFPVLGDLGFRYVADGHSEAGEIGVSEPYPGLLLAEGTLAAGIDGVAYLESFEALSRSENELLEEFGRILDAPAVTICVYDHPYYAGRAALDRLASMVRLAKQSGRSVRTLEKVLQEGSG